MGLKFNGENQPAKLPKLNNKFLETFVSHSFKPTRLSNIQKVIFLPPRK